MKAPTERQTQRAILQMLGGCFPDVFVAHVPNGAFLGDDISVRKRTMGMLLGDGLKPGFFDLVAFWNHGVGLMEVKRPGYSPSAVSAEQKRIHALFDEMGFSWAIVTSPEEAYDYLLDRGAPCRLKVGWAA